MCSYPRRLSPYSWVKSTRIKPKLLSTNAAFPNAYKSDTTQTINILIALIIASLSFLSPCIHLPLHFLGWTSLSYAYTTNKISQKLSYICLLVSFIPSRYVTRSVFFILYPRQHIKEITYHSSRIYCQNRKGIYLAWLQVP